jgi:hypothetical protein
MGRRPLPHDQFVWRLCFAGAALLLVAQAVKLV